MNTKEIITFFVILICALGVVFLISSSDDKNITQWVQSQGETVIDIDYRVLDVGPYFPMKNCRYYRVQTNKNVYWAMYGWGRTIKKEVGNKYETVD